MNPFAYLRRRRLGGGWHLLHIAKTGGSAVKAALAAAESVPVELHDHSVRLKDLPAAARAIVFVREPLQRFVSGFNSRLRQGRPRYDRPWSRGEAAAFARFPTANALAEALDADPAARVAIGDIQHTGRRLSYWLGEPAAFETLRERIGFVGDQATLAGDFAALANILGIADAGLPGDPVAAHVAPPGAPTALSDLARDNLTRWYADDIALYRQCLTLRAEFIQGP